MTAWDETAEREAFRLAQVVRRGGALDFVDDLEPGCSARVAGDRREAEPLEPSALVGAWGPHREVEGARERRIVPRTGERPWSWAAYKSPSLRRERAKGAKRERVVPEVASRERLPLDSHRRALVVDALQRRVAEKAAGRFVRTFGRRGAVDQEELEAAARVGLVVAASTFGEVGTWADGEVSEATREAFDTWAKDRILEEVRALLDCSAHPVSIDRSHRKRLQKQQRARKLLEELLGRAPSDQDIADVLGTSSARVSPLPQTARAARDSQGREGYLEEARRSDLALREEHGLRPGEFEPSTDEVDPAPVPQREEPSAGARAYLKITNTEELVRRLRESTARTLHAKRAELVEAFKALEVAKGPTARGGARETFRNAWEGWETAKKEAAARLRSLGVLSPESSWSRVLTPEREALGEGLLAWPEFRSRLAASGVRVAAQGPARAWVSAVLDQDPELSNKPLTEFLRGVESLRVGGLVGGRPISAIAKEGRNVSISFEDGDGFEGQQVYKAFEAERKARRLSATGAPGSRG